MTKKVVHVSEAGVEAARFLVQRKEARGEAVPKALRILAEADGIPVPPPPAPPPARPGRWFRLRRSAQVRRSA